MFKIISSFFRSKKNADNPEKENGTQIDNKSKSKLLVIEGEKEANKNNLTKALYLLDEALQLDPQNDCAYGDKALIFDRINKIKEAVNMYSKALDLNPKNPITWHNKGLVLFKQKKIEEAIFCFDQAIFLNKDYSKAWYNKGRCLELQGKIKEAQSCLFIAKKLDPFLFSKIKLRS